MDKDEISEATARVTERDGRPPEGVTLTTEELRETFSEASELQLQVEEDLGLTRAGWKHFQQLLDPKTPYGGGATAIRAVGEVYHRNRKLNDERLEIWWEGPESITKVVRDGKEYPHPTPEVIRMLVQ